MSRIAYVDGRYVPHSHAQVSMDDRGYQFADGVYEVVTIRDSRLVDEAGHLARLERSLGELAINRPMSQRPMRQIMRRLVGLNKVVNGMLYIQITRGIARRDHAFPASATAVLVMSARTTRPHPAHYLDEGVSVISIPDIRWSRRDIKSTSLLPNVLGKQQAVEAGAFEAWMIDDAGYVTEGTASNAWIITDEGQIITRNLGTEILSGITRQTVLKLAQQSQIKVVERPFTIDEAKMAAEAFVTSASAFVIPVTRIDDATVGTGKPGPIALKLRADYEAFMESEPLISEQLG